MPKLLQKSIVPESQAIISSKNSIYICYHVEKENLQSGFKTKVVIEVLQKRKRKRKRETVQGIAQKYKLHSCQISTG